MVVGVSLVVFFVIRLGGDPTFLLLSADATEADRARFAREQGFDRPIYVQYAVFVKRALHGDLGRSLRYRQPALPLVLERLPATMELAFAALVVSLIVAIPAGVISAVRRDTVYDSLTMLGALFGQSMPVFWLGIILIVLFSFILHWFPAEGPQGAYVTDDLNQLSSLVLPVATLSLVTIASFSRYMRSSTLENMVQDYTRTARAKGASNSRVLFVHVLRNAMIPILTLIGLSVGYVFSGALITEALFNYPGIGYIFWNATLTTDYPVILGVIVVTGFATVLGSLGADVMYAIADPRVRYRRA